MNAYSQVDPMGGRRASGSLLAPTSAEGRHTVQRSPLLLTIASHSAFIEGSGGATVTRAVEPWNALSKTILKAHDQLLATPRSTTAFCIVWVVAAEDDGSFVTACLEKRLLGVEDL
jgi:hypothetical protein